MMTMTIMIVIFYWLVCNANSPHNARKIRKNWHARYIVVEGVKKHSN
jgi:hypothetical protein